SPAFLDWWRRSCPTRRRCQSAHRSGPTRAWSWLASTPAREVFATNSPARQSTSLTARSARRSCSSASRWRCSRNDGMFYLTIFGGAFIAWLILVTLFTPAIPYHLEADVDSGSDHFIHLLESA